MFVIVRDDGKLWDGLGWSENAKPFCSIGAATRSLHEEGESNDSVAIILEHQLKDN